MKQTALDEKLGPLDLGPPVVWKHIPVCGLDAWIAAGAPLPVLVLCGTVAKKKGTSLHRRPCPDCLRLAGI